MELSQYLYPIRKWWWLLVVSGMLAAASSYYVVSQQPPVYQTSATILIGSAFENPNPSGSELYLGEQLAQTYANLSNRQPIRERTMLALGLNSLPEYVVYPIPQSQLLEILVTDNDPQLAQAVANELANQLIAQSPTSKGPEELARQAFVNDQLESLQTTIEQTEEEIIRKQLELEEAFSAREISNLQGEISSLQSKLNTLQDNYGQLLSGTQGGATNTLTLIEPATFPQFPVGPNRIQSVAVTVAVALALAAGTAYLLEYLDDTIRKPDDLSRVSNLPKLPSIPLMKSQSQKEPARIVALEEPLDPVVDALRALRTVVQFRLKNKSNPLILVTSSTPSEGKSLVSANLAVVLAQTGGDVLLVDADVRRPSLHKLFDQPESKGIMGFLLSYDPNGDPQDLPKLLEKFTQKTQQDHLWVMQKGVWNGYEDQIFDQSHLLEALIYASTKFDYVIIDSAPLLATSDSFSLSAGVDGVILLARAGKTRRRDLKQIVTQLEMVHANMLGIALNGVKGESAAYGYKYYQYYRSNAGASADEHDSVGSEEQFQTSSPNGSSPEKASELRQVQSGTSN